jgi:hypothetical protein
MESEMAIRGSITLGELAVRATTLDVACTRCERRARLRAATLVATHGADFLMTDLGALVADCPRRGATAHQERCDVYFSGLTAIMDGADPAP